MEMVILLFRRHLFRCHCMLERARACTAILLPHWIHASVLDWGICLVIQLGMAWSELVAKKLSRPLFSGWLERSCPTRGVIYMFFHHVSLHAPCLSVGREKKLVKFSSWELNTMYKPASAMETKGAFCFDVPAWGKLGIALHHSDNFRATWRLTEGILACTCVLPSWWGRPGTARQASSYVSVSLLLRYLMWEMIAFFLCGLVCPDVCFCVQVCVLVFFLCVCVGVFAVCCLLLSGTRLKPTDLVLYWPSIGYNLCSDFCKCPLLRFPSFVFLQCLDGCGRPWGRIMPGRSSQSDMVLCTEVWICGSPLGCIGFRPSAVLQVPVRWSLFAVLPSFCGILFLFD